MGLVDVAHRSGIMLFRPVDGRKGTLFGMGFVRDVDRLTWRLGSKGLYLLQGDY